MANDAFKAATGKLVTVDIGRGIRMIFRPNKLKEIQKLHTVEIEMHGTLVQIVLLSSHFNTEDMLQLSNLLSPRGIEVTLQHI